MENEDGTPKALEGEFGPNNKGWNLIYPLMAVYESHGGYIVVTPHSSLDGNTKHRWHWQDGDERTDYTFIETIRAWLLANQGVAEGQIFASGHSSGGIFLYSIAQGGAKNPPTYTINRTLFRAISTSGANMIVNIVETRPSSLHASLQVPLLITHVIEDTTQHWSTSTSDAGARTVAEVSAYFSGQGTTISAWESYETDTTFNTDRSGQYWYDVWDERPNAASTLRIWARAAGCNADAPPATVSTDTCEQVRAYSDCTISVEARGYVGAGHKVCATRTRLAYFDRFGASFAHGGCPWGQAYDRSSPAANVCNAITGWADVCEPLSGCHAQTTLAAG